MAFFPLFSLRILPAIAVAAVVYFGLRSRLNSTSSLVVFTFLAAIAAAVSAPILLSWVSLWWILGAVVLLLWRRTPATFLVAAAALLMGWTSWQWPDVALVVLAYGFALAVGVAGVWAYRPWHWSRPRFPRVALGLIVSIAAIGAVAATPQWRPTGFYEFHGEIPAAGTLLRVSSYPGTAPAGSTALRLLYATTRADGSPAVASAVAALPDTASSTAVAWQHGTTGVAQACAPSLGDNALTPAAIPAIAEVVSRGWNVVATDYPGQGTNGRLPYLIGQGEGRAALDSLRALRQLDQVPDEGKNMLWGHSQGGHATLFADQIAADYAPELEISGVAALSAAADPQLLAEGILGAGTNALGTVVGSYVLVPYAAEYPDVRLEDYMNPVAAPLLRAAAQRCADDKTMLVSLLSTAALETRGPLVTVDLNNSALGDRLRENTASGAGTAPLFLGQGVEDEVVPIAGQAEMA